LSFVSACLEGCFKDMSDPPVSEQRWWSRINKTTVLRTAGTLISLALLADLFFQQGWDQILTVIRQIPPWRLVVAFVLMVISRLAVVARWQVLLRSGNVPITYRQTLRITFAGLFASNFLPTTVGGDLVRFAGILQYHYDGAVGAASLIADRLIGMAGMVMVLPFSFPVLLAGNGSGVQDSLLPGQTDWRMAGALSALGKWPRRLWALSQRAFLRVYEALKIWLRQPRSLMISLGYTWVNMLCLFGVLSMVIGGEGMPIWLIGGLYSLVYFVTLIPISINGYGLQEFSMTLIFSNLGRASISEGLAAALVFRTLMILVSLPGALFLPDILAAKRRPSEQDA
jgi:uncharacterized membrane protein YbhN (UPF0104 family)